MKRKNQARVVQTLDSAILWINHYPAHKYFGETYCAILWIQIYPADSVIHDKLYLFQNN